MTPVYTYWDQPRRLTSPANRRLLDFWALTWAAHGWVPVVLGQSDLSASDREFHARTTDRYPTVNGRDYENACWQRWSALRNVGGGFFTDADVFNFGFKPRRFDGSDFAPLQHEESIGTQWCSEYGAAHVLELFSDSRFHSIRQPQILDGRRHLSDMLVISRWLATPTLDTEFKNTRLCWDHKGASVLFHGGERTPADAPLVHFSNNAMATHAGHTDRVAAAVWLAALQKRPLPNADL